MVDLIRSSPQGAVLFAFAIAGLAPLFLVYLWSCDSGMNSGVMNIPPAASSPGSHHTAFSVVAIPPSAVESAANLSRIVPNRFAITEALTFAMVSTLAILLARC